MSGSIPAGSWQRTGEYDTRGVPVLHGVRWRLPLCVDDGVDPMLFEPVSLLQQDDILYITYYAENGESACCAIEAQGGTLRWRFMLADRLEDLPESLREEQPEDRSPGTMVLTATTAFVGSTYGVVYGLDLSSGQPTWKMDIDGLQAQLGEETFKGVSLIWSEGCRLDVLAVVGNLLFVAVVSDARGICAIDIAERTCRWHESGLIDGPLTLGDQMLYGRDMVTQCGAGEYIYSAYDWHQQLPAWYSCCADIELEGNFLEEAGTIPIEIYMDGCLPLFKNTLYVVGWDRSHHWGREEEEADDRFQLMALDALTGKLRWIYSLAEFDFERRLGSCHVTVANGLVYVSSKYGERCAVDLETHQLRWHRQSPQQTELEHSSPVLADGLWYECRADGVLLVLDALTGEECWTYQFNDPIEWDILGMDIDKQPPCLVNDGSVYVIAGTTLYALH